MKKLFMSDKMLKIISVAVAIIIWLYIIIVIDPSVEVSVRDLPILFVGMDKLNENGLSIVNESATTLSLKVKGSRKKMGNNNMDTIIAKADVGSISEEGIISVPVEVVIPFENSGISSQNHYTVDVSVEKLVTKTLDLEIETEGTLAGDYMAGPIEINPSSVTISGPESVIGRIMSAGVVLNYGSADVDIDTELPIKLYGADGKEFSVLDAILTRINQDVSYTNIHCSVVKLKSVKITPIFDEREDREIINGISYSLNSETVQIYGDASFTSKINSISTEPIPLEKLLENKKVKVKLDIPEGVKVLEDISEVEISLKETQNQD